MAPESILHDLACLQVAARDAGDHLTAEALASARYQMLRSPRYYTPEEWQDRSDVLGLRKPANEQLLVELMELHDGQMTVAVLAKRIFGDARPVNQREVRELCTDLTERLRRRGIGWAYGAFANIVRREQVVVPSRGDNA